MKSIYLAAVIILIHFACQSHAQINIGGIPYGYYKALLKDKNTLPVLEFSELNNASLIDNALKSERKDQPWQFGLNRVTDIDIKKFAQIDTLEKGMLFRMKIVSKNALTLNFLFEHFHIPPKSVLYVYNQDQTDLIGGFTSLNNQSDSLFATGLIKGDNMIIEYFEPFDKEFEGSLHLTRVTHGFRSFTEYYKGFGQSGDCNMNVACPDGLDWSDEIRSVCMLVVGGNALCSGALINNTLFDGTPYVLTADHCYTTPSALVFMFNWESETCENPSVSPSHQDLSGSTLTARDEDSDFFLLKLNQIPPIEYNVYYSGWYKENEVPLSSVCIHHPSGDIKKISFDDHPAVSDQYLGYSFPPDSHWKVIWDRSTTTEGGSSGSPLFNQNHRIVGQLHGGMAACDNLDAPDWYGKFSYSWNTGSTPETRLKDWLDPFNTGISDLPGYDPNIPIYDNDAQLISVNSPTENIFDLNPITPSFKLRNIGNNPIYSMKLKYSIDNAPVIENPWSGTLNTGEIIDISFPAINLASGSHSLIAYVSDPNDQEDDFHYNDTIRRTFTILEPIFFDDFEKEKAWVLTGEFEIDEPQGLGGEFGEPDPKIAFSGNNVLGSDLTGLGNFEGDYENNLKFYEEYVQSPAINCAKYKNVILKYQRYLGVDRRNYDNVGIEIYNGEIWEKIWYNQNIAINDTCWNEQILNISDLADGKIVLLKFTTGPTNSDEQFCGWNIDDFGLFGVLNTDTVIDQFLLTVYPNPAKRYFYVQFESLQFESANLIICDITGKTVYQKKYNENEMIKTNGQNLLLVNYGNSDKGLFFIHIQTEKDAYTGKIILY
jgi:hypothetical protein